MKKFISLTKEWVEKNGQDTLEQCIEVASAKSRAYDPPKDGYYVCEVRKIISQLPIPVKVVDVREVE